MNLSRRGLFRAAFAGAVAVAAAPALAALATIPPKLWGDGVHDDTAVLQALIDRGGIVVLPPGVYRLTSTLTVNDSVVLTGSGVVLAGEMAAETIVVDAPGRDVSLYGLTITGRWGSHPMVRFERAREARFWNLRVDGSDRSRGSSYPLGVTA